MEYLEFYDIADYGNDNWKGNFTQREVADNAYIYKADFDWSIENKRVARNVKELVKLLDDDGSKECKEWAEHIRKKIPNC